MKKLGKNILMLFEILDVCAFINAMKIMKIIINAYKVVFFYSFFF